MRFDSRLVIATCAALGFFAVSAESFAQVVPPSVDPGNVGRGMDRLKTPDVTVEPIVNEEDSNLRRRDLTGEGVTFELKSVTLEGAAEYKNIGLESVYGEHIGERVSLRTLHAVADKMTTRLRNEGYVLSKAVVPSQRVNDGRVVIRIIGGEVSNVVVEGDVEGDDGLIRTYADKIRAENPLNFKRLERYLLLMEDLPGVTAKGYLRPGRAAGSSELVIKVTQDQVEGRIGADNRGNRYLGPLQGNALVKFNSVLGMHEQTALRTSISAQPEELKFFELLHEQQIGHEGTKLVLNASHTRTRPGSTLEPLDIEGENNEYGFSFTHPFIRSRSENLFADIGFTYRDTESKSPLVLSYEDNVRVLNAGLAYDFAGIFQGINRVEGGVAQGLDILGSNNTVNSRVNADETFTKFTGGATHLRTLYGPLSLQLAVTGQYSNDPLFASEEFGVGGAAFGGAYDAFEISGDSGVAARGELQLNDIYVVDFVENYQLYGFYDAGKVWNQDTIVGEAKDAGLTSAGLGVRFNLSQPVYGGLEVAFPLSREVQSESDKDPRVFFNLSYQL